MTDTVNRPRIRSLSVRYEPTDKLTGPTVHRPADVADYLVDLLSDEPSEVFGVLLLDTKSRVLAWHEVSRGTIDASMAHPREIFRAAILSNAAAVILAHNHPSGTPAPSLDDRLITERIADAGAILGINVLDHVIAGDRSYYSFSEAGQMPAANVRRGGQP